MFGSNLEISGLSWDIRDIMWTHSQQYDFGVVPRKHGRALVMEIGFQ
jgi:hypothetical protein